MVTIVWLGLFFYLKSKGEFGKKINDLKYSIKNSIKKPMEKHAVLWILFFVLFLLLPLFWGLAFYLRSDVNVVVVLGFLIWMYNWIKYIFITNESAA